MIAAPVPHGPAVTSLGVSVMAIEGAPAVSLRQIRCQTSCAAPGARPAGLGASAAQPNARRPTA